MLGTVAAVPFVVYRSSSAKHPSPFGILLLHTTFLISRNPIWVRHYLMVAAHISSKGSANSIARPLESKAYRMRAKCLSRVVMK
jgi:hypothetical protein